MPTQLETIIAIFRRTGFITAVKAKRRGIVNLRARINELRQLGYSITSEPYRRKDGREAVKYVFDEGQTAYNPLMVRKLKTIANL